MNLLQKLELLKTKKEGFPLSSLLVLIENSQLNEDSHDLYSTAMYLSAWLSPIANDMNIKERRTSVLDKNPVIEAIAYWTKIPMSVVLDTYINLKVKGEVGWKKR